MTNNKARRMCAQSQTQTDMCDRKTLKPTHFVLMLELFMSETGVPHAAAKQ